MDDLLLDSDSVLKPKSRRGVFIREWHSVEDGLPDDSDYDKGFLVTRHHESSPAFVDKLKWFGFYKDWQIAGVTAWMPLPPPYDGME